MVTKSLALVLAVALAGGASCSRGSDVCTSLASIASDEQKMRYAKKWIASHLADRDFCESLRLSNSFDHDDGRIQKFGGLDWKYLGIPERYAELRFIMPTTDSVEWDITRVLSASLSWGRSFIIIKLSPAKDLGFQFSPEDLANLKTVDDGVLLYCDPGG